MNYSYKNKVLNNTIKEIIDEIPFKKVAIITGGCGLLGWEHALALRELNYKIVTILDNSQKDLKKRVIENKKFPIQI